MVFGDVTVGHPQAGVGHVEQNVHRLPGWNQHRVLPDDVVALIHIAGLGRASGATTDVRFYAQVKVRDGKIVYIYDHEDRAAALEAAGVPG